MARDLTANSTPKGEEFSFENPFVNDASSVYDDSIQEQSATSSSSDNIDNANENAYGRIFKTSPNETTAPLLSSKDYSSDEIRESKIFSNNSNMNIQGPSEYDRYPVMFSESSANVSKNNLQPSETSSLSTLQQFKCDSSPFGGYPASSFPLHIDEKEPDDYLHNPDPVQDAIYDKHRFWNDLKNADKRTALGMVGFAALIILALLLFVLLPVLTFAGVTVYSPPQHYEILTDYQYPMMSAVRQTLIDPDTPEDALTTQARDGSNWVLVFSDEFNADGRTFYDGDDQFWTAANLHYDATKDLEWYDPDAVTTANGTLSLRMDAFLNHNLYYRSGMVQSWNKFCFTQGKIVMSARLPNYGTVSGLWPGMWTLGNLGRPGYMASTEGVWPYSYDSCDAGITPNQSSPDGISYLPGQKLNSCTCPGESHPNPGTGRGAPEIDVIEAAMGTDPTGKTPNIGVASQSLQLAPFDIWYMPDYSFIEIYNASVTTMNTYAGGPFQEALSGTTTLNTTWYEFGSGEHNFQEYGFEYLNNQNTGYLRWFVGQDPTLTVHAQALHPNGNINWRSISKEPMSIIMNLGLSNNWAYIDWPSIQFPVTMRIDYVRVYQPENSVNVGCDPDDFPTFNYIQQHLNIYSNVNLTSFKDGGYAFPKNKLVGC
ncbi:uncharacterized protein J8A68_002377 [[Candida] subhashii]|uniref:GH16 domain-containing protein n=1 Tax=[Candida] subhashii TaxID=561895 RepID=A0A8J5QL41_9ASCO|nr:uncharacterized protein J8A68_002377 [[Candida] subhashii]KAG7664123.1 hypothetical protein J8A68_002377 [[Candida] subhashii]